MADWTQIITHLCTRANSIIIVKYKKIGRVLIKPTLWQEIVGIQRQSPPKMEFENQTQHKRWMER